MIPDSRSVAEVYSEGRRYRLKDLADVQELIKVRDLSGEFANKLNPYVREEFLKLLEAVQQGRRNHIEE